MLRQYEYLKVYNSMLARNGELQIFSTFSYTECPFSSAQSSVFGEECVWQPKELTNDIVLGQNNAAVQTYHLLTSKYAGRSFTLLYKTLPSASSPCEVVNINTSMRFGKILL